MVEEGVHFVMNKNVEVESLFSIEKVHTQNDILLLACGATNLPRYTFNI